MAAGPLFEYESLDLDQPMFTLEALEKVNPHRGIMRLLDQVVWESEDGNRAVAYRDINADEFWVPGHIPGRPLFPGVLMLEAAAQLASFVTLRKMPGVDFMGFGGVDSVKFRGQVTPGQRLIILCQQIEFRPRRSICQTQGWVEGRLVFEGVITGLPM
ncbi:MAG: beta-hydroxyacyl-ACP dehydratase [Phycisphaeraceae bacterium]|nr:beta-hydroxyacyl-ACP dehydratase [Phycisphaeraceae bacterium]